MGCQCALCSLHACVTLASHRRTSFQKMLLSSSLHALLRAPGSASIALLAPLAGDFFFDGVATEEVASLSILRLGVEGCSWDCSVMMRTCGEVGRFCDLFRVKESRWLDRVWRDPDEAMAIRTWHRDTAHGLCRLCLSLSQASQAALRPKTPSHSLVCPPRRR